MLVKTTMRRNWGHIGPKTLSMEMFLIWLLTFRIWTVYSLLEERQKFILLTLFETFPSYSSVFSREIMIVPVGHHDAIITKSKWHISWFSLEVKASPCNVGDLGSIPGLGRSPGEGNGNPLQYSCLENPMDGGAWWSTVHGSQRVGHDWATSLHFTSYRLAGDHLI